MLLVKMWYEKIKEINSRFKTRSQVAFFISLIMVLILFFSFNDQVQVAGINLNNFLFCEEELSKQLPRIPPCENDEGITRNRSHFPEHPELFQPMPIPTPTKKLRKPSNDNPEVPESHTIKNRKAPSSEKVNE